MYVPTHVRIFSGSSEEVEKKIEEFFNDPFQNKRGKVMTQSDSSSCWSPASAQPVITVVVYYQYMDEVRKKSGQP